MKRNSIELFSDFFAQSTNILTQIDARIKLVFVIAMLMLVITGHAISAMLVIALSCMMSLLLVGIPYKTVLARLAGPILMVVVIMLLQGLMIGKTSLVSFDLQWIKLSIYKEGLGKGILIAARVIAGTSLVIFLSMTTPLNKLLGALKYFRVPGGWLEILSFTYRYIFVFIDEAQSIMDSQRLRLGYSGVIKGLRSWGTLIGSLFARVYDQANATHAAMLLRGYNGSLFIETPGRFSVLDIKAGMVMTALFLVLLATTI